MKKLWTRFKHWLIKKLGGYVAESHVIQLYSEPPVILTEQLTGVWREEYRNNAEYKKYTDKILISKLTDYLYEHREDLLYIQESTPNDESFRPITTIDLRATCGVYPMPRTF